MLGLFNLIKHDLDRKNQLPLKYYDIPKLPIVDRCTIYVDAINNTGNGHSNSATTWKNLKGSANGTRHGTAVWEDDALILSGSNGFYFSRNSASKLTIECVCSASSLNPEVGVHVVSCMNTGGSALGFNGRTSLFYASAYDLDSKTNALTYIPESHSKKVYLALIIDGSNMVNYYANTNKNLTASIRYGYNSSTSQQAPWAIGYNPSRTGIPDSGQPQYFQGKIHSVRIHSRALSPEELRKNCLYERKRYDF